MINFHCAAYSAVPTFSGGDAQACLGTKDQRVAGGVDVQCPRDAEVKVNAALQADVRACKIVNAEFLRKLLCFGFLVAVGFGVFSKIVGLKARNGNGLGIAEGIEAHIQGVTANVGKCANTCGILADKGILVIVCGNAATATSSRLNVIDLAKLNKINNSTVIFHLKLLEEAELVTSRARPNFKGKTLIFYINFVNLHLAMQAPILKSKENTVEQSMGVGNYIYAKPEGYIRIATDNDFVVMESDDAYNPKRFEAKLLCMDNGEVTYAFSNAFSFT